MSNAHRGFKTPLLAERLFFFSEKSHGFFLVGFSPPVDRFV